jgi:hypothetical protein
LGEARIASGKKYQQLMFLMRNIMYRLCMFLCLVLEPGRKCAGC